MFHFFDTLFPSECIACGVSWLALCTSCKKKLCVHPSLCPYCHHVSESGLTCLSCFSDKRGLDGCIIAFRYEKILKEVLLQFKYYHKKELGERFAEQLSLHVWSHPLLSSCSQEDTIVSFIPMHRYRKYFSKWYNQAEVLASLFADRSGLHCRAVLKKTKQTKQQAFLSREERQTNLQNNFSCIKKEDLSSFSRLILIDDVTTTGSTLESAAQEIKQSWPHLSLWWCVLARHG